MGIHLIPTNCPQCNGKLNIDMDNNKAVCEYCQTEFIIHDDEVVRIEIVNAEQAGLDFGKGMDIARQNGKKMDKAGTEPDVPVMVNNTSDHSGCLLLFVGVIMIWLAFVTFCGFMG